MAERIKGYNENKDYTGFVCKLARDEDDTYKKLASLGAPFPDGWKLHPEGFVVKEDHKEHMLIQFYDVDSDSELTEEFWINFDDAVEYWA
ncbi:MULTISPECIES: hypothetical protein [Paenibacillus]|uniref:Uncharacterized protein n=2 Tax=Paenibacillus TaxID=44249 RepID=A0ABX2ZC78_PAEPO|nr:MULTISPECIES: hypothetical protein [Paenibacillus]MDR6779516.1 hypothetical protein [Paenibacillus peoriae]ODA09106.1 hypothetical protein A7312_27190 [Paenibacillus polymyxa]